MSEDGKYFVNKFTAGRYTIWPEQYLYMWGHRAEYVYTPDTFFFFFLNASIYSRRNKINDTCGTFALLKKRPTSSYQVRARKKKMVIHLLTAKKYVLIAPMTSSTQINTAVLKKLHTKGNEHYLHGVNLTLMGSEQ